MALKTDAAAQLTAGQIELVDQMEQKIDEWLSRKYSGQKEVTEDFYLGKGSDFLVSEKVTRELAERYRRAGWSQIEITHEIRSPVLEYTNYHYLKVTLGK